MLWWLRHVMMWHRASLAVHFSSLVQVWLSISIHLIAWNDPSIRYLLCVECNRTLTSAHSLNSCWSVSTPGAVPVVLLYVAHLRAVHGSVVGIPRPIPHPWHCTAHLPWHLCSRGYDQLASLSVSLAPPFSSDRQHLRYDDCLEVRGEMIRTVLCCIVYWSCAQS